MGERRGTAGEEKKEKKRKGRAGKSTTSQRDTGLVSKCSVHVDAGCMEPHVLEQSLLGFIERGGPACCNACGREQQAMNDDGYVGWAAFGVGAGRRVERESRWGMRGDNLGTTSRWIACHPHFRWAPLSSLALVEPKSWEVLPKVLRCGVVRPQMKFRAESGCWEATAKEMLTRNPQAFVRLAHCWRNCIKQEIRVGIGPSKSDGAQGRQVLAVKADLQRNDNTGREAALRDQNWADKRLQWGGTLTTLVVLSQIPDIRWYTNANHFPPRFIGNIVHRDSKHAVDYAVDYAGHWPRMDASEDG